MKTKKITVIGSEKPIEITFRAVDKKDIKEELVCDKICPIKNICEKLIDPDCINNPEHSFNSFCCSVGFLYDKPYSWAEIENDRESWIESMKIMKENPSIALGSLPYPPKREIDVVLVPEITEEEAINLIGLKDV